MNDAPVAGNQSLLVTSGTANLITLTGTDVEGAALTYTVLAQPMKGVLSGTAPNLNYTLKTGVSGSDSFTFKVNDGTLDSAVATVSLTIPVTTFSFSKTSVSINEDEGPVRLEVLKTGPGEGSVFVETFNTSAVPRYDFKAVSRKLDFSANESTKVIEITLVDDFMPEDIESFKVRLSEPSSGGEIEICQINIIDNDGDLENNSFLEFSLPDTEPDTGALQIVITPKEANGQWRRPWDIRWRKSNEILKEVQPGSYPIEFRPTLGFVRPGSVTNVVLSEKTTTYVYSSAKDPFQGTGTLRVFIHEPDVSSDIGQPFWRIVGDESAKYASGQVCPNLAPGTHLVEFLPIPGRATPGNITVIIESGVDSSIGVEYRAMPSQGTRPEPLKDYSVIQQSPKDGRRTYQMAGQIRTPYGWASGVAVRDRVVLTAAHVLFDSSTNLVDPTQIQWFHARHAGPDGYEPQPIQAKGYYFHTNYLTSRIYESTKPGWTPGSSTPKTQEWDVAALYFDKPVARNAQSGYLLSDKDQNNWLLSDELMELVGYPTTGSENDGRLHSTRSKNYLFEPVEGTTRVFQSGDFFSLPGNSGGPLCVRYNRTSSGSMQANYIFFPAAVYLGNYGGKSIVRSIDSMVASLINRAASSAKIGENFVDNGPLLPNPGASSTPPQFGFLQVRLGPSEAISRGAGWRIVNYTNTYPSEYLIYRMTGTQRVEFTEIPGFRTPLPRNVTISPYPQTNSIPVFYEPLSRPLLSVVPMPPDSVKISVLEPVNARCILESSQNLKLWTSLMTNMVPFSLEVPVSRSYGTTFFRASGQ